MKMVYLVYSHAADADVLGAIKSSGVKGYTKMERACGEGIETEPKLHSHTWPGENCFLFMALEDSELASVTNLIRKLKQEHPRAGIKGFILSLEEII